MEEVGGEECFYGMADGVAKVDEVAEVGFLWIVGDDGSLCVDGRNDEGEEGVGRKIDERLGVDVGERIEERSGRRFEEGERVFVPDGRGL